MTQPAAGWYDQPDGTKRYWDGQAWTEHTARPDAPQPDLPRSDAPQPDAASAVPVAPTSQPAVAAPVALPPSAPAKKRKVWPWIVGIGGGLLILIIGGIVAIVMLVLKATEGPREAVEALEDSLVAGDCQAFTEMTTTSFREMAGFGDCVVFESIVASYEPNESMRIHSTDIQGSTATVVATEVWAGDSATYEVTYSLIKGDDGWKVDDISYVSSEYGSSE